MKIIFAAIALAVAAPAVAQNAQPQADHSQHQGHDQQQGNHAQHQQGQQGEGHHGECCRPDANGRMPDCCGEGENGQRHACCDEARQPAPQDHSNH